MNASSPSIHERMASILGELPAIGKVQHNTQQNFMFRGHDDVLNALNPLLAKHQVFVVPSVLDRATAQRQTAKGSVMFEVNLLVSYRFYGPVGDFVEASAWGEGTDMGDKATNKAMTMAFKNVLNQAFAINTQETIDSDAYSPEETVSQSAAVPTVVGGPSSDGNRSGPTHSEADAHGLQSSRADNVGATPGDASDKQKAMIRRLAKKLNLPAGDVDALGKREASAKIEELLAVEAGTADAVAVGGGSSDDDSIPF